MKKFVAFILAVLICTSTAFATEWVDGRSASKPYAGLPAVDLSEKLGYMMFYPNAKMIVEGCCRTLYVYLPRTDVKAGKGTLYLCSSEQGELLRLAFNDEQYVACRPMSDGELNGLMWGEGTCFEVTLPFTLGLNKNYFVNLSRDCVVTVDGKLGNPEIGGTEAWTFSTDADYGVSGMRYRRPLEEKGDEERVQFPKSGDEVALEILLGGPAVSAVLYCYDDSMDFDEVFFSESSSVTGRLVAGEPNWGVAFFDVDGNVLDMVDF